MDYMTKTKQLPTRQEDRSNLQHTINPSTHTNKASLTEPGLRAPDKVRRVTRCTQTKSPKSKQARLCGMRHLLHSLHVQRASLRNSLIEF